MGFEECRGSCPAAGHAAPEPEGATESARALTLAEADRLERFVYEAGIPARPAPSPTPDFVPELPHVVRIELRLAPHCVPRLPHVVAHFRRPRSASSACTSLHARIGICGGAGAPTAVYTLPLQPTAAACALFVLAPR